jgi:predicted metalloprotease with PDZ domain
MGLREFFRLSGYFVAGVSFWLPLHAQSINYRLSVHLGDTTGYDVEMRLQHVPHQLRLAMATHHEYDDRFYRFVRNFRVRVTGGQATFVRTDSAVYDITIPGDQAVVSYSIRLPPHRFAHQPFLSRNGGLVGDIHSFFYLVGGTKIPATVDFDLPKGWTIATGLEPTGRANSYRASSAKVLMDCPVLVGHLWRWHFMEGGQSYGVSYLPVAGWPIFDTAMLLGAVRKIVHETVGLFGSAPYTHYDFLLVDGVYGALEHANSVTIGTPAAELADRMQDLYEQLAHEFFHTWNLVNIEPSGYTDLNYGPQEASAGLWFSEGLAMFYADLLVRRAGLPTEDSTRLTHLSTLIRRYYADTGNSVFSPAAVSLASNAPPGALGDYSASTHVQGELIGALLDMLIRSNTNGRRSFDDVMRLMYRRFGGRAGFSAHDVEQAVQDAGGGTGVHTFFDAFVDQGKPLDFDAYLRLLGLRLRIDWKAAVDDKGIPVSDTRLYIWQPPGDSLFHLILTTPQSCWGRAGLHTNDALRSINGHPINDRPSFYTLIRALKPGDTVIFQLRAGVAARDPAHSSSVDVPVTGYQEPRAGLLPITPQTAEAQMIFRQWASGN